MDAPANYYLNDSMIYTYAFTNTDHSGTITMMFTEFNLDAGSLMYIYDGSDVSAPASVWTSYLSIPMYSSTGPHIFMVFKTGMLNMKERNIGFAAQVNFLAQGTTWETKPDIAFCSPLMHMTSEATLMEIVYNATIPSLPVQSTLHTTKLWL